MTTVDTGVLTLVGDCDEGPSVCDKDDEVISTEVLDIDCVDGLFA